MGVSVNSTPLELTDFNAAGDDLKVFLVLDDGKNPGFPLTGRRHVWQAYGGHDEHMSGHAPHRTISTHSLWGEYDAVVAVGPGATMTRLLVSIRGFLLVPRHLKLPWDQQGQSWGNSPKSDPSSDPDLWKTSNQIREHKQKVQ